MNLYVLTDNIPKIFFMKEATSTILPKEPVVPSVVAFLLYTVRVDPRNDSLESQGVVTYGVCGLRFSKPWSAFCLP